MRLAVGLAFADASIVVLALPEIVARLHVSISHVTWVIMAYNLALIAGSAMVIPVAGRIASREVLVTALALFGLASIGCGVSDSMEALVPCRCVQGLGGGLLLSASLALLAPGGRSEDSAPHRWSMAAAIGMAVGPAAGGILTQLFNWRSIFLAQAPVALLAIILLLVVRVPAEPAVDCEEGLPPPSPARILTANAALTLVSAGLMSALFLVVLLLISAWQLTPIHAAEVVTSIPVAAVTATGVARGRPQRLVAAFGAVLVALGLLGTSLVTHREVAWLIVMLAMVGAGIGFAFPSLTGIALSGAGPLPARTAKTVAARDGGIVLGLLILTPIFVHQLDRAPPQVLSAASAALLATPISSHVEASLVPALLTAYRSTPEGELPNFAPPFARARIHSNSKQRVVLKRLQRRLDSIVQHAVTRAFRRPLRYGVIFALAVLPLLGLDLMFGRPWRFGRGHQVSGARE